MKKDLDNSQEISDYASYWRRLAALFLEQVSFMCMKNVNQKQRNGRKFWKDTVMIQFFTLSFITLIIQSSISKVKTAQVYEKFVLPPLSKDSTWGVFNSDSKGNAAGGFFSSRLYYTPNNHAGVQDLINSLVATYPDVEAIGAADETEMNNLYETNLFDTWATIEFTLSDEQKSSGTLVTSQTSPSTVSYVISINPLSHGGGYSSFNFTETVYNKQFSDADLFWNTGYLTLQNFCASYLSQKYDGVADNFQVSALSIHLIVFCGSDKCLEIRLMPTFNAILNLLFIKIPLLLILIQFVILFGNGWVLPYWRFVCLFLL